MKLGAIILCMQFLYLAWVPCVDAAPHPVDSPSVALPTDHDHSSEAGGDHCPPFCPCECCQLPMAALAWGTITFVPPSAALIFPDDQAPSPQALVFPLWRPPLV